MKKSLLNLLDHKMIKKTKISETEMLLNSLDKSVKAIVYEDGPGLRINFLRYQNANKGNQYLIKYVNDFYFIIFILKILYILKSSPKGYIFFRFDSFKTLTLKHRFGEYINMSFKYNSREIIKIIIDFRLMHVNIISVINKVPRKIDYETLLEIIKEFDNCKPRRNFLRRLFIKSPYKYLLNW